MPEFRKAQETDLPELSKFINSAYRGESSKKGWTTEAGFLGGQRTDPDLLKKYISGEEQVILIFEKNEKIYGCVYLSRQSVIAYLGMLTVDPALQGAGLGKQILLAAENWCLENWRSIFVEMTVISIRNELIAWYERHGYLKTGEARPFPYGDEKFGIPKRQDLEFCVLQKRLL